MIRGHGSAVLSAVFGHISEFLRRVEQIMEEKEKEARIRDELARLKSLFENIPDNQKALVEGLIQNAAFMKITLEDIQVRVMNEGVTDVYQNGENQKGVKQAAALQSYNALVKNYDSVIKHLNTYLPKESGKGKLADLRSLQKEIGESI